MSDNSLPPIDPEGPTSQPNRTRRWVRITLFLSLAVNILIIGLVVGAVGLKGRPGTDGNPRLRDAGLGPLGAVLSREQQAGLRKELRTKTGDLRQNREQMRADLERLLVAMRSDVFDPDAVAEILADQRRTVTGRVEIGHQVLIDAMANASVAERRAMADRLERALSRGRDKTKPQRR